MSNVSTILWIYTALLVVGGLMGFLKAGSKPSLIMSVVCAIPLAWVALGKGPLVVAEVIAGFLAVFFVVRYRKTKKPMPAVMIAALSVITLILLLVLSRPA